MSDPRSTVRAARPISDSTLIEAGGVLAIAAGLLRFPASFLDPDTTGTAIETLYFAIDVSLLFAAIAAYVASPASRSRIGTVGFVLSSTGAALLIGPEPTDTRIDSYAIGAAAVAIGFALLALAWRRSTIYARRTRAAFLATPLLAALAGLHAAAFAIAGVLFSFALVDTGFTLIRTAIRDDEAAERSDSRDDRPMTTQTRAPTRTRSGRRP